MFVSDYRPTKRIGLEELDGCLKLLRDEVDEKLANGEADAPYYEGAWLAMQLLMTGKFDYPHDFMQVFANDLATYTKGE